MTKYRIFQMNLDIALYRDRMPPQAEQVVLNALASNDALYRASIISRVHPEDFKFKKCRIMFQIMTELIQSQGQVDIKQVRKGISVWAKANASPEITEAWLASLEQALSYNPTPEHVKRAIDILTSPVRLEPILPSKKEMTDSGRRVQAKGGFKNRRKQPRK